MSGIYERRQSNGAGKLIRHNLSLGINLRQTIAKGEKERKVV